jgi:hypothetical protein
MIAATVNGQDCWILPYAPNTPDSVVLEPSLPVDAQRGLTGASSRRPQGIALRYSLSFTAIIGAADFAALRNASQAAQDEPILVPVWPHAIRVGIDTATMTGGLTIAWTRGWVTWAINPVSLASYDFAAPLLYGRFSSPPTEAARNDDKVTTDFAIDEDAPVGYAFAPADGVLAADTTFATAGGFAAPIFPFTPEWSTQPQPGMAVTDVERTATGPGRQKATTFYPQTPELTHQAHFRLKTAADAARLIAWWSRRAGIADPHWVAGSQAIGKLSADVAAAATVLNFSKPIASFGGNVYLALFDPSGRMELARILTSTSTSITLAAGLQGAWSAVWTTIAPAMLARHTGDKLSLEYRRADTGWVADCTLAWREVQPEYAPPDGETRGVTLGRLPGAAWFFQVDLDYAGAIASTYLTNWESGAVANSQTWVYNPCDFDKLVQSIDLEDDNCTFTLRWWDGCPWENWMPGALSARGFLTIFRSDVSAAGVFSNFRQIWKGELSTPTLEGPDLTVTVIGANALFGRQAPRQVMSPTCGTNLFKPRCGLALADWMVSGVIISIVGQVVTIGPITHAGGLPPHYADADFFALGWAQWTDGGGLIRRSEVLASVSTGVGAPADEVVALTLGRPLGASVGATIQAAPGCNRLGPTCRGKFNNGLRFRGFEFMPAISPSFIIPQQNVSAAKK